VPSSEAADSRKVTFTLSYTLRPLAAAPLSSASPHRPFASLTEKRDMNLSSGSHPQIVFDSALVSSVFFLPPPLDALLFFNS